MPIKLSFSCLNQKYNVQKLLHCEYNSFINTVSSSTTVVTLKKVYDEDEKMFYQAMEIFHPYDEDFISLLNIYFRLRLAGKNQLGISDSVLLRKNQVECLEICQKILINYRLASVRLWNFFNGG